jgi:ribosomal protein L29
MADKKQDYSQKEIKELEKILKEKEKEFLDAKTEVAQRKNKNVHTTTKIRKEIARIKTAITTKQLKV